MNPFEDRLSQAGHELRHAADRMPAMQVPRPRPLLSALAFAAGVAVVLLLVAVSVWLLSGTGSDDRPVADATVEGGAGPGDVFMLPGFVPEGFTLSMGQLLGVAMRGTEEPSEAAGIVLQYLPGGSTSFRSGEPSLTIEVTDLLAVFGTVLERDELECYDGNGEPTSKSCREYLAKSTCVGEEAIAAGELDPEACIAEEIESVTEAYGDEAEVDFVETTVRGLPAHITTMESPEPGFISVTTYEGGPVVSIVTGHVIDEATLLQVANELQAVGPKEFNEATTQDGDDAEVLPGKPNTDGPAEDLSDKRAEAEHWYRLEEALIDAAVGLVGGALEPNRITVYVDDPDGARDVVAAAGIPDEIEVVVVEVGEAGPQPARWQVHPDEALDEATTTVRVLVEETSCASGRSAAGRILEPEIGYTPEQIFISIRVQPLTGSQDCPGNPKTPYVIHLDEPLGERELVDANHEW